MWQTIITVLIVALALFFIGKKLYYIVKQAVDPKQDISCSCGCSGCSVSNCNSRETNK
ncbi:MAG TPA: FeoB-associated Cys-rich membrane protein [Desulfobacterales bacterium]|nr:FeoB-associated Cys-rich membrane protein [Desulfobacterales bacterium]HIP40828.1 FeoB-associated Cys-rich membrane protein [Desulfocapsa sulfexigens]